MAYGKIFRVGRVPEWPKGADCNSVSYAFEGSNPSPPSIGKWQRHFSSEVPPQNCVAIFWLFLQTQVNRAYARFFNILKEGVPYDTYTSH